MNENLIARLEGLVREFKELKSESKIIYISYSGVVQVMGFDNLLNITGGKGEVNKIEYEDSDYPYELIFKTDSIKLTSLLTESDFEEYKKIMEGHM